MDIIIELADSDLLDVDENETDNEGEIEFCDKYLLSYVTDPLIYSENLRLGSNDLLLQKIISEIPIPPPKY